MPAQQAAENQSESGKARDCGEDCRAHSQGVIAQPATWRDNQFIWPGPGVSLREASDVSKLAMSRAVARQVD
jgi:hypothetical protein